MSVFPSGVEVVGLECDSVVVRSICRVVDRSKGSVSSRYLGIVSGSRGPAAFPADRRIVGEDGTLSGSTGDTY